MGQNNDLRQEIIDGLNTDLSHEYQAVVMYNTYAAMASGIHRPFLKDFFEAEVADELRHARLLSNKVTALGGKPTTTPAEVPLRADNRSMLAEVLKAETETIERYVQRRKQAEEFGDYGLANDLDDLISDETRHKEETEKLLRGISD